MQCLSAREAKARRVVLHVCEVMYGSQCSCLALNFLHTWRGLRVLVLVVCVCTARLSAIRRAQTLTEKFDLLPKNTMYGLVGRGGWGVPVDDQHISYWVNQPIFLFLVASSVAPAEVHAPSEYDEGLGLQKDQWSLPPSAFIWSRCLLCNLQSERTHTRTHTHAGTHACTHSQRYTETHVRTHTSTLKHVNSRTKGRLQ